jgi:hypothetical protein
MSQYILKTVLVLVRFGEMADNLAGIERDLKSIFVYVSIHSNHDPVLKYQFSLNALIDFTTPPFTPIEQSTKRVIMEQFVDRAINPRKLYQPHVPLFVLCLYSFIRFQNVTSQW